MNIEKRLFQIIGEEAGYVHTARSRNDQVITDFKIWIRSATKEINLNLDRIIKSTLKLAEKKLLNHGKLLAEAHTRNTVFFMPIIFALIVMLTILNDNYSRLVNTYKKTFAIGLVFVVQSLTIILKNAVHNDISLLPLMYLFPTFFIFFCFISLSKKINTNKNQSN